MPYVILVMLIVQFLVNGRTYLGVLFTITISIWCVLYALNPMFLLVVPDMELDPDTIIILRFISVALFLVLSVLALFKRSKLIQNISNAVLFLPISDIAWLYFDGRYLGP